jgi:hypothetical protein
MSALIESRRAGWAAIDDNTVRWSVQHLSIRKV